MQDMPAGKVRAGPLEAVRAMLRLRRGLGSVGAGVAAAGIALAVAGFATGFSFWHLTAFALGVGAAWLLRASRAGERAAPRSQPDAATIGGVSAGDLLAQIAAPAIIIDNRDVVLIANAAAQRFAPLLQPGNPLYEGLRQPDILAGVQRVGESHRGETVAFAEPAPDKRVFDVDIAPLQSAEGEAGMPRALVLWFHDRTEIRRAEEMRSDFVANASHELRTPLASVLGFIETLQGPARDDAAARTRFLDIMAEQARRMARLIDDLLSLSRIEMRQHVRPTAILEVEPLIGHICDTLRPMAVEQGVSIQVTPSAAPHAIVGERDEILRVLENLVENAIKYGATGGKVEIAVGDEPASAGRPAMGVITVRDHGPGIAPEHLPRLTERFYRVDVAASRGKGGTGLGLAIVKHIVARHGGRLSIESRGGEGAIFQVRFPLAPPPTGPSPAPQPDAVTELSSS